MRILYAEDDVDVRQTVIGLIQMEYTCDVVETGTGKEAIAILEKDRGFDVIISDYNMPEGSGGEVYSFVKKNQLKIPFLLFSARNIVELPEFKTFFEDFLGNGKILKPATGEELWEKIEYALGAKDYQRNLNTDPVTGKSFRAGPIDLFLRFNKAPCDVYLRLAEEKYVKIVNSGAIIILETVQKYYEKGVTELFVSNDDYYNFSDALVDIMTSTGKITETLPTDRVIQNLQTGYKVFKAQLQDIGLSPQVVDLAHATVENTVSLLRRHPQLDDLLSGLEASASGLFGHSLLTSYLAYAIAHKTEWVSEQTLQKLTMASFLHDIMLDDESGFAMECDRELSQSNMSAVFYDHPIKTAEMARQIKGLPSDLDHIIMQHHERPDGLGFPRKMSCHSISPLAAVFIVAHESGLIMMKRPAAGPELRKMIVESFGTIYNCGNFKSAYAALATILPKI